MPVIIKLTPNITDIRKPARAAKAGGTDAVSLINTINSITGVDLDSFAPEPTIDGKGTPWRLLRPGGEADRPEHGGRDRPRPGDARPADLRHRRHHHLARRGRVHGARRRQRAGLHGGHDLRLQDRAGDDLRPRELDGREGPRDARRLRRPRHAQRHRLAVPQPQLRRQGAHRPGPLHQVRPLPHRLRGHLAPGDHQRWSTACGISR